MPEDYEIAPSEPEDIVERFEDFLNKQDTLTLNDLDNMEMVIYVRLRSLLTVEQLHHRAHSIIQAAEELLHTPGALQDTDTGEVTKPLLVENFPGGVQEVLAMTQDMNNVSDDEIAAFLTQFGVKDEEE
jgi:hypothetical protein